MTQPPPRTRAELRAALSVQETTGEPSGSVSTPQGASITRAWRWAAPLAAVALWWPAGFAGLDDWFYLPLRARDGDLVLVGSMAATATVAALVRSVWLRLRPHGGQPRRRSPCAGAVADRRAAAHHATQTRNTGAPSIAALKILVCVIM